MDELYKKSLQNIKLFNIMDEKEYNRLMKYYAMLSVETLKFMSETKEFEEIIRLAKEA